MAPRTDRRRQQGDDTRERILDAAVEVATERGYDGTSMAMIAKRAGASMSSIYWHFSDKDDLLAAVIQRSFEAWSADGPGISAAAPVATDRDLLVGRMAAQAVALTRNPDFLRFGLMLALEHRPTEPAARARFLELRRSTQHQLQLTFRSLLAEAGHDVDGGTIERAADLTMACADGLFIAAHVEPDRIDVDATFALLLGALLDRVVPRVALDD
jgi:AcrR family transcriptional regulator